MSNQLPAFLDGKIAVLQDKYSISFTCDISYASPMMLAILGDPLALLWWGMRNIKTHWYLQPENFPGAENE